MSTRSSLRSKVVRSTSVVSAGLVLAVGASACGTTQVASSTPKDTVDVWFVGPTGSLTPITDDMEKGIKVALEQHGNKAGLHNIRLRFADPSTVATGAYDGPFCATIGNAIASDPNAVIVFAPFNSGCVKEELKTLGDEGIPVLSATNTYLGLTQGGAGTQPGEPGIYQSSEHPHDYFRLVAPDNFQAAAALKEMKALGIKTIAVANDGSTYGAGIATQMQRIAPRFGITVVSNTKVNPEAANYGAYARSLTGKGRPHIEGFFYGASTPSTGINMFDAIHNAMPHSYLFGPDALADSTLTQAMPQSAQHLIRLTIPVVSIDSYPGGKEFRKAFEKLFPQPAINPYALPAYVSTELAIKGISEAGPRADVRSVLASSFQRTTNFKSAMGDIGFTSTGDTTNPQEGLYGDSRGNLTFSHPIQLTTQEVQ